MRLETGGTTLYPICHNVSTWNIDEDNANARLIAAAPELLELVLQAHERFTDNDFMPPNHKLSLWLKKVEALTATLIDPTI